MYVKRNILKIFYIDCQTRLGLHYIFEIIQTCINFVQIKLNKY